TNGLRSSTQDLPHRRALFHSELSCHDAHPRGSPRHRCRLARQPARDHAHQMSRPPPHAVAADTVFDGHAVHRHWAVLIDGAHIRWLGPRGELPSKAAVHNLPGGCRLAPGFIDVQVNGGGDVLLNDDPTPAGIHRILAAHRRFGTTALLPTLISDTPEKMREA